jgi:hypothetical protein
MSRDEANLKAKEEVLAIYKEDGGTKEADLNFSLMTLIIANNKQ